MRSSLRKTKLKPENAIKAGISIARPPGGRLIDPTLNSTTIGLTTGIELKIDEKIQSFPCFYPL